MVDVGIVLIIIIDGDGDDDDNNNNNNNNNSNNNNNNNNNNNMIGDNNNGIVELYEQLLPTRLYNSRKTKTTDDPDARCRMCGKAQKSVAHVLSGCSVLAHTKYLSRHNAALKYSFLSC